jgi:fatty-acyl-CoA synthase
MTAGHTVSGATDPGRVPLVESYWPADRAVPLMETTCGDVLRDAARSAGDAIALVSGVPDPAKRRRWTYEQLFAEAQTAARALLSRLDPGERVAVWAPNIPQWTILQFGAALAGMTLVTVNPLNRDRELTHVLRQSRAAAVFLVPEFRGVSTVEILDRVRPQLPHLRDRVLFTDWAAFCATGSPSQQLPTVSPSDAAQIQYTSGTTGTPKGAVIHHCGLTNNARFCAAQLGLGPGDVLVNPMPLFHTAGSGACTLAPMHAGATQVLMPYFDPALMLELLETEGGTVVSGVPTMLYALLDHADFRQRDLSRVRIAFSGGAPVPPSLARRIHDDMDIPVAIVYAQTEASPIITGTLPTDTRDDQADTVGRAYPHTEVRIADPSTGATVPIGRVGEICTRGYHVMTGYFDDPAATAQAVDSDGWLHTGDLGTMDGRGYCRVQGRVKEMIIRGGENIYPQEIEMVLREHPGVTDVAVVGVSDEIWGEQVAAFIVPANEPPPLSADLDAYCRDHLARFKVPQHWVMVDTYPMTASGKIQKYLLREQFATGAAAAAAPEGT